MSKSFLMIQTNIIICDFENLLEIIKIVKDYTFYQNFKKLYAGIIKP